LIVSAENYFSDQNLSDESWIVAAVHGNYMANTYDFYKPNLASEYPEVDGPVSVVTYIAALDASYAAFKAKLAKQSQADVHANGHPTGHTNGQVNGVNGHNDKLSDSAFSLEDVDFAIFHSPYGKQTVKGHARLLFNDFLASPSSPRFAGIPNPETFLALSHAASLTDKSVEKTFISAAKSVFGKQVAPAMACSRRLGNMYTASLYGCLASLLSSVDPAAIQGKRVSLFAFGSGCAASFFTLRVKGDTTEIKEKMDLLNRLASMKVVPCQEYVDALGVSLVFLHCFGL
jgi:hydroxymethylglutaryl-CoA synthase